MTKPGGRCSIGSLFVRIPSTSSRPQRVFGMNIQGIDIEARTAWARFHSRRTILSPVLISVAIIVRGICVSEKDFPSKIVSRNFSIFCHLRSHFFRSISISFIHAIFAMIVRISSEVLPRARSVPIIAPILVPAMATGDIPSSSSRLMTPIWASPRAAHPPSARENGDGFIEWLIEQV